MKFERVLIVGLLVLFAGCSAAPTSETAPPIEDKPVETEVQLSPAEIQAAAKEAYIFGFPMVMNYKTMWSYVLEKQSPEYKGEFNQFHCDARLLTPDDKAIVTPNSDTPYCMAWFDLSGGPLVVEVPAMAKERFYHIQLTDWYTHNFAYIGTRTNQNKAGKYLLAGPGWKGEKPEGIDAVLQSETPLVFSIIRTQLLNNADLPKVKEIQSKYKVSRLEGADDHGAAIVWGEPMAWKQGVEFTPEIMNYLDFALKFVEPNAADKAAWDAFAKLGLGGEQPFDVNALNPETQAAIAAGVKEGLDQIKAFVDANRSPLFSTQVFGTRSFLTGDSTDGSWVVKRAAAALMGLYGNDGAEAAYPLYMVDAQNAPLDASTGGYTITFPAGKLPPADAFWSLSMYDGKTQLFIHNPLNRYLLKSSNLKSFVKNADGSITFLIQKDAPAKDKTANWLPAPDGPFYMVLRIYLPKEPVLNGSWTPPAVQKNP